MMMMMMMVVMMVVMMMMVVMVMMVVVMMVMMMVMMIYEVTDATEKDEDPNNSSTIGFPFVDFIIAACHDLRADDNIRKTAIEKCDERIIALVSRELVAAEAHYTAPVITNLTVVQLARENVKLQEKQTLIDKAIDNEHHIIEAALCIREKLKTLEINSSWPPNHQSFMTVLSTCQTAS
ncbi:hypothetical protein QZH41_014665 [Actinostola sp. cb2023]|nr:hypothetical protein QZH41_014665 [Actinostola sp. cb2023]